MQQRKKTAGATEEQPDQDEHLTHVERKEGQQGIDTLKAGGGMDFLAEQRIGIESCLTSNIQTSTVSTLAQHPLKTFLEHGVLASLNTDDPAVQGVDIIHEYNIAAPQAGLSREQIRQAQINGLEIAFLTPEQKQALRDKVASA